MMGVNVLMSSMCTNVLIPVKTVKNSSKSGGRTNFQIYGSKHCLVR